MDAENTVVSFFPNAHDFTTKDSHFTSVQGSQYINHYSAQGRMSAYIPRGRLAPGVKGLEDYFVVEEKAEGNPGECLYIVRRFKREEERDMFEARLGKTIWNDFSMKPLWKLSIGTSPCLAVSSAPVYTLREIMQGREPSPGAKQIFYLKLVNFFRENDTVYPGTWNGTNLWKGVGKYKDLRLFNEKGDLVMDTEYLGSLNLLHEEFEDYKKNGEQTFYERGEQFRKYVVSGRHVPVGKNGHELWGRATAMHIMEAKTVLWKEELLPLSMSLWWWEWSSERRRRRRPEEQRSLWWWEWFWERREFPEEFRRWHESSSQIVGTVTEPAVAQSSQVAILAEHEKSRFEEVNEDIQEEKVAPPESSTTPTPAESESRFEEVNDSDAPEEKVIAPSESTVTLKPHGLRILLILFLLILLTQVLIIILVSHQIHAPFHS